MRETVLKYCRSIRIYLMDNHNKKYDFLFGNIIDLCYRICLEAETFEQHLNFLEENLENVFNYELNDALTLDKYIVKIIKTSNYQALISDNVYSDEDSDPEFEQPT